MFKARIFYSRSDKKKKRTAHLASRKTEKKDGEGWPKRSIKQATSLHYEAGQNEIAPTKANEQVKCREKYDGQ